ncbi:MAG: SIS domain-containing protein, partial [Vicinamibacteraceae bacterium]
MIPIIDAEETRMYAEAAESPRAVAAQRDANREQMQRIGRVLRERQPRAVVTCARGSSDRAATFGRYLIETRAGVFTSSLAPSVSSVYAVRRDLEGFVFLAISQSGQSPDLLASVEAARAAGAFVIALVNV